jgi:hypothetical protein
MASRRKLHKRAQDCVLVVIHAVRRFCQARQEYCQVALKGEF